MKKVLILDGSMRKQGNTSILVDNFIKGAEKNTNRIDRVFVKDLNLEYCNGCLRCNLIKRCAISGDDWQDLSQKILEADILVFASPIYFHYVTAALKKVIDRFRSFVHVQITEKRVDHTPREVWNKDFVLLLSMGSSDPIDAQPVIDLFEYMKEVLGEKNKLHIIKATRLAVIKQITKSKEELKILYPKLKIPIEFVDQDNFRNMKLLQDSYNLGYNLTR